MKQLLLASTLLCGLHGHALAADAVVDEVMIVEEGYNWSGVYIGAQIGYAWGSGEVWYTGFPEGQFGWEPDPDGIMGGAYAGYNWQMSNGLVLGVETDININDGSDQVTYIEDYLTTFPGYWDGELRQQWSGSTRLRVGYAMDRFMGFVTGGVAYTGYEFSISTTEGFETPEQADGTLVGWTIGAGLEYALNDNWRVRGTYQFADYGDDTVRAYYDGGVSFDEYNVDLKTHTLTLGVSYNF